MNIRFTGTEPTRAYEDDAGLDLYASQDHRIGPGGRLLVGTGTCMALPPGTVGLVCPRSGLAHNDGLTVLNAPGIIDAGYRGEIRVNLINHGDTVVTIKRGDRIAQLVILDTAPVTFTRVAGLPVTTRGTNGHGSTGA